MKKNTLSLALAASLLAGLAACSKEDTTPAPNVTGGGTTTPTTPTTPSTGQLVTVGGSGKTAITTNTTWSASNKYLLKGFIYVQSGATLTIEAGTVIKGDKDTKGALIIEPGAKIMAVGTAEKPVFGPFTKLSPHLLESQQRGSGVFQLRPFCEQRHYP